MNKNLTITFLIFIIILLSYIAFSKKPVSYTRNVSDFNQNNTNNLIEKTPETKSTNLEVKNETSLYLEEETDPLKFPVGSSGKTYRIMAKSNTPTKVTYTIKGQSSAVVPSPVQQEFISSKTVFVQVGTTIIGYVTSTVKPELTYKIK